MEPWIRAVQQDLAAVRSNEPSIQSDLEAWLCHTPLHAIALYRLAHRLEVRLRWRIAARVLAALARWWTGVEIHPAARIGRRFFIDHGTGVVVGETAEIGDDCVMFHNVTLGGTGKHRGKRHPSVGHGVLIGTGATLLGPIRVGDGARVGAGAFIRMHDVPPGCTAVGMPARIVRRDGRRVDEELPGTELSAESIPVAVAAKG